jgi:hypothetical protein
MEDVPPIPNFKIVLPTKGKFNGIRAHYNIRTDPDLGIGWAALRRVACGCASCKERLMSQWVPGIDRSKQTRYAQNLGCSLWPSYEGANDWKICRLVPKSDDDEKAAKDSFRCVLNAFEARISLIVREGDIGVVGTEDEAAMGYYLVKWLSEPYTLQEETEGMSEMIGVGVLVMDAIFYNRVGRAPFWYTLSETTTVVEAKHVLQTGLKLQPISVTNKLPATCNIAEATRLKAVMVALTDHDIIMDEAMRRDVLEYDTDEGSDDEEEEEDEEERSEDEENQASDGNGEGR